MISYDSSLMLSMGFSWLAVRVIYAHLLLVLGGEALSRQGSKVNVKADKCHEGLRAGNVSISVRPPPPQPERSCLLGTSPRFDPVLSVVLLIFSKLKEKLSTRIGIKLSFR